MAELPPREASVLALSIAGRTYADIAREWGVAEITVHGAAHRLFQRLGAHSMPQAVLLACRAGYLDGRPFLRHGDHAGYEQHVRRRIPVCEPCREGERAYRAGLKAARAQERPSEAPGAPGPSRAASEPR